MLPRLESNTNNAGSHRPARFPPNPRSVSYADRSPGLTSSYWDAFPPYGSDLIVLSSVSRLLG